MSEYVNYNSVVINLEPTDNPKTSVQTATFDQAFLGEEFSEARGRGRARRKKRKLERIAGKREVRTERRKLKADRQEERIARRKKRKEGRQEIRDEQQEARMQRRNKRREDKENRKGSSESDNEDEEETATQQGGGTDKGSEDSEDSGRSDNSSSDSEDTGTSRGGSDDYSEDTDSYQYGSEDEDSEDQGSDEEEDTNSDEADENFAGDGSDFAFEVTGKPSVPSAIQTICYKIEMNNEMMNQLLQHKKMLEARGKDTTKINNALSDKFDQNQKLEGKLESFAGADGRVDPAKAKSVKIAKAKARKQRIENLPIPPTVLYKLLKKGVSKDKIKSWWETKGRKAHASKMNFEGGTDDFGIDPELNDYFDYSEFGVPAYDYEPNSPEVINLDNSSYEPTMNFGGDSSSSNTFWRSFLIGGLIAFAGIYVIRKYKLLK